MIDREERRAAAIDLYRGRSRIMDETTCEVDSLQCDGPVVEDEGRFFCERHYRVWLRGYPVTTRWPYDPVEEVRRYD